MLLRLLLIVFAIAVFAPAASADAPFVDDIVDSGTADDPWSVFAADVDGDGDLDVLSASHADGEINWYENDGTSPPGFTPHLVATGVTQATAVFAADVDSDGDVDLLSASLGDDTIAWYESDGASPPAFTPHTIATNVIAARAIFVVDLDGDGDADVLSAPELDNRVLWFESDGASPPSFTERTLVSGVPGATAIRAADMDGDGDIDVLSSSENDDTLAWYENDGAIPAGFVRHDIFDQADAALWLYPGDIDGDGDVDVALASISDSTVRWLENDGNAASFTEHAVFTNAPGARSVFVGDLDNDGDADLVAASEFDDTVRWFENDGAADPAFTTHVLLDAADGASSVYAGDLDSDGDVDVFSVAFNDDTVRWYDNQAIHEGIDFDAARTVDAATANPGSIRPVDLDTDGDLDAVVGSFGADGLVWLENDGQEPPGFTRAQISAAVTGDSDLSSADFDGDGDQDVISADSTLSQIRWHENDGASPPGFSTHVVVAQSLVDALAVADFDRDGDLDVAGASGSTDEVYWYESDGNTPPGFLIGGAVDLASTRLTTLRSADLDADGDPDLVAASATTGAIFWYENDGAANPSFSRHDLAFAADPVAQIDVGDVDSDGDLDVVGASTEGQEVSWYESDGAGVPGFTAHPIADLVGAMDVVVRDVDRDGDLDVVAASNTGSVAWFANDGAPDPSFDEVPLASEDAGAVAIRAGDFDGDGRLDVLTARSTAHRVALHRQISGQALLDAQPAGVPYLLEGATPTVMSLTLGHLGRPGESGLELERIALRFESSPGVAMTSSQLNALVSKLWIYADDNDTGAFEPGTDPIALEFGGPIGLDDGIPDLGFSNGAPAVQVSADSERRYGVALELKPSAASEALTQFRIVHASASGTRVEDSSSDLALRLFPLPDGATLPLQVVDTLPTCSDGIDNDSDGFIDHPADPECTSYDDPREAPDPKQPHCGIGFELAFLLPPLMALRRRRATRAKRHGAADLRPGAR